MNYQKSCQNILDDFERTLRQFIAEKLEATYGKDWWKTKVPDGVVAHCQERLQTDEQKFPKIPIGQPIDYTHIGELKDIIVRRDNYREVFGQFFGRDPDWIRIKLQEIGIIRDPVRHVRPGVGKREYDRLLYSCGDIYEAVGTSPKAVASALIEFVPITPRFGDFRQPGEDVFTCFRPSFEEFKRGQVHRPRIVDETLAVLNTRGWAWLRGVSATGKSTVALHIALEISTPSTPALHLDLGDESDIARACDEISSYAAKGRLFVLDNVHANPRAAAAVLRHWEENRHGSHMLLLGWAVEDDIEKRNLATYRAAAFEVLIGEDDLRGVYATVCGRLRPNEAVFPQPPLETVRDWLGRFGADLVAFQIALAVALRTRGNFAWLLDEATAQRYVREKYLDACSDEERSDLIRLALFTELSLSVPEECFKSRFNKSSASGTVRKSKRGRFGQFLSFRLWHQALGRCLLAANLNTVDKVSEFTHAAIANPFFGYMVGRSLWKQNQPELATRVLRSSIGSTTGILGVFGDNLRLAVSQLELFRSTGVLDFTEVAAALTTSPYVEEMVKRGLATPLHFLVTFLGFALKQGELKPVYEALTKALVIEANKPDTENRLLAQVLESPLGAVVNFLGFALEQAELKSVHEAFTKALVMEAKKPAAENRLLAQAMESPLDALANFLGYAAKQDELKPVYGPLVAGLECNAGAIAGKALVTAFSQIYPLLIVVPSLGRSMLSKIAEEDWKKAYSKLPEQPANTFGPFAYQLKRLGFTHLAEPPASRLVTDANPAHWQSPVIGLLDISQALRHAAVSEECKARFVAKIVVPDWLTKRYHEQPIHHLAGGLFHLLAHQPRQLLSPFILPVLKTRVGKALLGMSEKPPEEVGAILQLWAAAELAGGEIFVHKVRWPAATLAEELATKIWPHLATIDGIGYIQQQLWIGLRLFAWHHPSPVPMLEQVVLETMRRWSITALQADRTTAQKGWDNGMMRWLEQCAASPEHVLVKDPTPLPIALNGA